MSFSPHMGRPFDDTGKRKVSGWLQITLFSKASRRCILKQLSSMHSVKLEKRALQGAEERKYACYLNCADPEVGWCRAGICIQDRVN